MLKTVGDLEDRLKRHEDLLDGLDQRVHGTDVQVTQLWKQMDKVNSLERQQKEQETSIRDILRWNEQLIKAREQEALEFEERFSALKGGALFPQINKMYSFNAHAIRDPGRARPLHLDYSRQAKPPLEGVVYKF